MDFFDTPDLQNKQFDWAHMAILLNKKLQSNSQSKFSFNHDNSEERVEWKKFTTSDQDCGVVGFEN